MGKELNHVNCKHFHMPRFNTKTLHRLGYCPKFYDKCMLLDDEFAVCILKEEWEDERRWESTPVIRKYK